MQMLVWTFRRPLFMRIEEGFYLNHSGLKGAMVQHIELVDDGIIVIFLRWVDGRQLRVVVSMSIHSI